MLEILLSILIILGGFFTLVGSLGLFKLPDFYMRLHGPTKASTLGVGAVLVASAIHFSTKTDGISLHEILVTLFLFIFQLGVDIINHIRQLIFSIKKK